VFLSRQIVVLVACFVTAVWVGNSNVVLAQATIEDIQRDKSTGTAPSVKKATKSTTKNLTLEERVKRLERKGNNRVLVNMLRQLEEIQAETELMRSEFDELSHNFEGMRQRQRDIYLDLDRRMQQLESRGVAGQASDSKSTDAARGQSAVAGVGEVTSDTARKAYEKALGALRGKRYDEAISALEKFVADYPQSDYAVNAQYWLGETYYVTRRFQPATKAFKTLIQQYPKSSKVADSMLKLGFTYYELEDWDAARQTLTELKEGFPKSASARLAGERLQRMTREGH